MIICIVDFIVGIIYLVCVIEGVICIGVDIIDMIIMYIVWVFIDI